MSSLDEMLASLRKDYIANIGLKVEKIEMFLAARDFECIKREFHNMKGSGASHGVPEMSLLGSIVEDLCLRNPLAFAHYTPMAIQVLRNLQKALQSGKTIEIEKLPEYIQLLKIE
jgi:HPt (histidine-containing phosphotransfer) domain-containing protein